MTNPTWFNKAQYLGSKLAQLIASGDTRFTDIVALDVAIENAGYTAYSHFQAFSLVERTAPNSYFNAAEYLEAKAKQANTDKVGGKTDWTSNSIALAIKDAGFATLWDHFAQFGWKEGVNPSNAFDVSSYFDAKLAQLQTAEPAAKWTMETMIAAFEKAGIDPVTHALTYGVTEKVVPVAVPNAEKVASSAGDVANAGKIIALNIGEDNKLGTSGNDTFSAPVAQDNKGNAVDTLESFDVLDGGAGTDTLNATINSGTPAPAPVLKNIENVNLRFAAAKSVDLTSATGVTTIKVENSTDVGSVNGVGTVANLAVANQLKGVNFDSSTATTLALNLDTIANATGATQVLVDLGATAAHKATTLNITANNANVELRDTKGTNVTTTLTVAATGTNTLKLTEAVKATTVTVTGTGSADLTGAPFTGALTKFDAAANEGGVKADIQSSKAVVVTTGKGNDVIDMDTTVQNDSSVVLGAGNDTLYTGAKLGSFTKGVDGGEGTDIINITDGSKLDATTSKYITNFETLDVSGAAASTFDVSLNSFATVQIDEALGGALKGDVKFDKASDTFTLNILSKVKDGAFDVAKNTVVALKDDAGTTAKGDAETFTLVATINDGNKDGTADGINAQQITVANVEKLVVTSNVATTDGAAVDTKAAAHTLTAKFVADKAETISITGNGGVDLSSVTTIGVVNKVDASGSTGNVKVSLSTQANSVAYTGSEGVDTYTASKAGDTIYTGKGADVIDLTASTTLARDTFVLKAATDSQVTDTFKDGKITLAADTGFDAITKFDIGGGVTADRIDLTNFGFSGAQRGVENVNAKVAGTTDLTSVVDLFSSVAGDRGVAFSNLGSADTYVFVDANKDGNFTAADDIVIKLAGVASISEADINF